MRNHFFIGIVIAALFILVKFTLVYLPFSISPQPFPEPPLNPIQPPYRKQVSPSELSPQPIPAQNGKNSYLDWPVRSVCFPGGLPIDQEDEKLPKIVLNLHDDTYIYKDVDGTLFRGTANGCD